MKIAITITRSDFTDAVAEVLESVVEELDDKDIDPMGKLILPVFGMEFAKHLEKILFKDDEKVDTYRHKEARDEEEK